MIIDRYIAKKYVSFLFFSITFFISVYVVVDFSEHILRFVREGSSLYRVFNYYYRQIPLIINIMLPVSGMLAAFFTYGRMNQYRELLTIKLIGIDNRGILKPLIYLSVLITILFFIFDNYITTTATVSYREMYYGLSSQLNSPSSKADFGYNGYNGMVYYISYLRAKKNFAKKGVVVKNPSSIDSIVVFNSASFDTLNNKWVFYDGYFVSNDTVFSFIEYRGKEFKDKPKDMISDKMPLRKMRFSQLISHYKRVKSAGLNVTHILSEIADRLVYPFMFLFLSVLGGILAISMKETSMAKGFGLCLMVSFVYWGMNQIGKSLGQTGYHPVLSVVFPHIIMGIIVVFLLIKINEDMI